MLEEGYESGCLKIVSNDFELSYNKMLPVITECAEKDWNEFEEWTRHMWGHVYESTMTFYYSPIWGSVKDLSSFEDAILSMKKNKDIEDKEYEDILLKYNSMKSSPNYMLGKISKTYLLGVEKKKSKRIQQVSRTEGMYGIFRKISSLQRLFSGHVLRSFDLNLVDIKPEIERY